MPKRPPESFFTSAGSLAALAPDVPMADGQSERPTPGVPVRIAVLADSAISCPAGTAQPDKRSRTLAQPAGTTECSFGSAVGDHAGCCMGAHIGGSVRLGKAEGPSHSVTMVSSPAGLPLGLDWLCQRLPA